MTTRWIMLMRGNTNLAAFISFFELLVYVVALGLVVTSLDQPPKVVVYALGYATGSLLGAKIEQKLALGLFVLHVITHLPSDLPQQLRAHGLGVTSWRAEGREHDRLVLFVVGRRRLATKVQEMIAQLDPKAFIVRMEPQELRGGFLTRMLKAGSR